MKATSWLETILEIEAAGEKAALCMLVWSKGSVPMSRRAKMIVRQDGSTLGTVGGGCLEDMVWKQAQAALQDGRVRSLWYSLTEYEAEDAGLICGGRVLILSEPVGPETNFAVWRRAREAMEGNREAVIATLLPDHSPAFPWEIKRTLITEDDAVAGSLGSAELDEWARGVARSLFGQEQPRLETLTDLCGKAHTIHLEAFAPEPTLFIFGAGHVAVPVARMGKMAGFRVVVIDDRERFANRGRFPEADEIIVCPLREAFARIQVDCRSYLVSVTRGHAQDEAVIEQAIRTPAKYVGMIGSRVKRKVLFDRMVARGTPAALLERVHSPIGLEIGADTPEEIAVSILAEIISVRRAGLRPARRTARPARNRRREEEGSVTVSGTELDSSAVSCECDTQTLNL